MKKKKKIALIASFSILLLAACSDKDEVVPKTPTEAAIDNPETTKKDEFLLKKPDNEKEIKQKETKEERIVSEIMNLQMNHHRFGKYFKKIELTADTAILHYHNSYDEFKKTSPDNIEYNVNTFPDIYERYASKGNFQDVNAYLITGSTYVLANYPSIKRVVYIFPQTIEGKYYTIDVNREDLFYVLGFDVDQLAKEEGEDGWGEKFNASFASEYSYPLTEEPYDSNKRFLNLFLSQTSEQIEIKGEVLASITKYTPIKASATIQERIEADDSYQKYLTDLQSLQFEDNNLTIKLSKDYEGERDIKADVSYLVGRLMADFPELETVEVVVKNVYIKVNRNALTNYLGSDIATWVDIDTGDLKDWTMWEEKFLADVVHGKKKNNFFEQFGKTKN